MEYCSWSIPNSISCIPATNNISLNDFYITPQLPPQITIQAVPEHGLLVISNPQIQIDKQHQLFAHNQKSCTLQKLNVKETLSEKSSKNWSNFLLINPEITNQQFPKHKTCEEYPIVQTDNSPSINEMVFKMETKTNGSLNHVYNTQGISTELSPLDTTWQSSLSCELNMKEQFDVIVENNNNTFQVGDWAELNVKEEIDDFHYNPFTKQISSENEGKKLEQSATNCMTELFRINDDQESSKETSNHQNKYFETKTSNTNISETAWENSCTCNEISTEAQVALKTVTVDVNSVFSGKEENGDEIAPLNRNCNNHHDQPIKTTQKGCAYNCKYCHYKSKFRTNLHQHKVEQHNKVDIKQSVTQIKAHNEDSILDNLIKTESDSIIEQVFLVEQNQMNDDELGDKKLQSRAKHKCTHCSYETDWKGNLTKHVISRHTSPDLIDWFNCVHCEYKGKTKEHLKWHLINSHNKGDKKYNCTSCGFMGRVKSALDRHIIINHTPRQEIKWHECVHCCYKSKFKTELKHHILLRHTKLEDIAWFRCPQCPYQAKRKRNLTLHIRNKHTPEEKIKWFKCEQCAFRAKRGHALKRHVSRVHDNEKKKKCVIVTKDVPAFIDDEFCWRKVVVGFRQDEDTTTQTVDWFKCNLCDFKSLNKGPFERHLLKRHSVKPRAPTTTTVPFTKYHCSQNSVG